MTLAAPPRQKRPLRCRLGLHRKENIKLVATSMYGDMGMPTFESSWNCSKCGRKKNQA